MNTFYSTRSFLHDGSSKFCELTYHWKKTFQLFCSLLSKIKGGTELDDWPGGIKQKYATLYPMIAETMKALKFDPVEIRKREYLGGEMGEDDAVGIWSDLDQQICICCFPTPDTIPAIIEYKKWTNINSIFVIINQQFFLDPLSKDESKNFLSSAEIIYRLESLNMRGPGALPVRGILYRQYPNLFKVVEDFSESYLQ